jgi:Cyclic nucleotide-binding domain
VAVGQPTAATPRQPLAALRPDTWYSKLAIHKVPATYLLGAFLVSYLTLAISWLEGVPVWLAFALALVPWGVVMFVEIEWAYAHFHWLALFFAMAFVQVIHYAEHCIQLVQYHVFDDPLRESIALFSSLNLEYVHFLGDTFLTIGTLLLLWKFPRNPWIWVAFPFQIIHQFEHNFLWFVYQFLDAPPGTPGVLAKNGVLHDGIFGLVRLDLHWIYNTLYTIPFVLALIWQLKRTYDESLDEAFPDAPKQELLQASKHLATLRYNQGQTLLAPGDDADRLYIITEGIAIVSEHDAEGNEVEVARLHRGQFFGEVALLVPDAKHTKTVRALTNVTVQAMDDETFEHLMAASQKTHDELESLARSRMAGHAAPATDPPA